MNGNYQDIHYHGVEHLQSGQPPIGVLILITSVALVVVLGIAWVRARGRAKRAESALRELQSAAARAAAAPDADMRHAIEAIAIEVERIGEGQRFMTGVLAKRPMNAEQKRSTP